MKNHRNEIVVALGVLTYIGTYVATLAVPNQEKIALHVEIRPSKTRITVGENVSLDMTVRNNNRAAIEVRGLSISGQGIRLTASGDSGSWPFPEPPKWGGGSGSVVLDPGEMLEVVRFAHPELHTTRRWPGAAGRAVIKVSLMQVVARFVGEEDWRSVSLEPEGVTAVIEVLERSEADRRAAEALESRLATVEAAGGEGYVKGVVDAFVRFLREYGESSFAPEVRFNLAIFVVELLGNQADALQESDLPEYVSVLEENVSWCIRQRRPFGDPFTSWNWDRGGNAVFELAFVHGKRQFLRELCDALDSAPNADIPSRLFRRAVVLKLEGKGDEAMDVLRQLEREWPTHKATEHASDLLR